jgi:nucleotide-binding universal stress UspA family protein
VPPTGHVPLIPERYARSRSSRPAGSDSWRDTVHDTLDHPTDAVVVGYDGSASSTAAVDWAAAQAARTGARLDLVSAWEYPTSWGNVIPLPNDYDPAADARALLDPVVDRIRSEYPDLAVHAHVIEGHASDVLVEASRHAALLVVASRGHGTFSGMVLGSVSQHCVTHAVCPVVVYRAPRPAD